jgi:ParB-like chromosome segregation protein Spo0J
MLDGHDRMRVCRELGINDYPVVVRSGLTEEQKRSHARRINLLRRHLKREQVQQLIAEQIKETPN